MLEPETPHRANKQYSEGDGPKDWQWQPIAKDLSALSEVFRGSDCPKNLMCPFRSMRKDLRVRCLDGDGRFCAKL